MEATDLPSVGSSFCASLLLPAEDCGTGGWSPISRPIADFFSSDHLHLQHVSWDGSPCTVLYVTCTCDCNGFCTLLRGFLGARKLPRQEREEEPCEGELLNTAPSPSDPVNWVS